MNPQLSVRKITDAEELKTVFEIRHEVFVIGQKVPREEEFDEFEDSSHHFMAFSGPEPAGVARWRYTEKGIKMERFAVLDKFRSQGVGSVLVEAVEEDIRNHPDSKAGDRMYMHAQVTAMGLYAKYNYQKRGDLFLECDIEHFLMEKTI